MSYLPSLPGDAVLLDVLRAYPQTARPLLDYHQARAASGLPADPEAGTSSRARG